ncbi:hypothetical protein MXL46_18655 [Heyndrickxia sporothermodurans]|uniref:Uncharacterized protein n=1 Tax=Heyndrickxia sporothermodurans TaxID=46224 RepID=A0AB37HCF7_9BACI|nr:hypothetical protein [Heyndrickxia sporothermodurans]MBL5769364.1 hypothetical protein [Heyndrickxia sporothermodurans]MBL5773142.1 hypothetical protein [Heyndrickxia sporothermodurans]MBL5776632.1 hypothetical protein [Heyndrickxia sporothermodurans]MBL5787229.1 hypothetical protein [Heyndrickxia sporothermodurans]MBL5790810.1 hypothetical protein [Heyndrickxia sporothermodurans]
MTKQEFLKRLESERLNIGEYIIIIDKISDAPLILGCAYDQGVWKVYETRERGGHFIIKEIDNEDEAFDYFYKVVLSQQNRLNN